MFAGALPGQVWAQPRGLQFDIPAGPLGPALRRYGKTARRPLIFSETLVAGKRAPAVRGEFTAEAALERLLAGSGLGYERSRSGALMIVKRPTPRPTPSPPPTARSAVETPPAPESPVTLDPILITALKRPLPARRAPVSLSVITGDRLGRPGAEGLGDVLALAPGVQFSAAAPGISSAAIRGISTGAGVDRGQGVTGYFIDEVSLTDPYFATGAIDIDTFDLENVTILRGPQNTLYGAAAFGGAVNYQTRKPDLARRQAHLQVTAAQAEGAGASASARAMLNLPIIEDVLALRGAYVYRKDAGYIDNAGLVRKDSNSLLTRGGRIQLAWVPTASTRVSLMRLEQFQDTADLGYEIRDPFVAKDTPLPEAVDVRTALSVLRIDQSLALGTLTLQAARRDKRRILNTSAPVTPQAEMIREDVESFAARGDTLEVRLASPADRRLTYLVGVSQDEVRVQVKGRAALALATARAEPSLQGSMGYGYRARVQTLFGEAGYRFDDRWRIELGGRLFRLSENDRATVGEVPPSLDAADDGRQAAFRARGFTPQLTLAWTPNDSVMAYAVLSKGTRYGGLNIDLYGAPATTYRPDTLVNREIGLKLDLVPRRLGLDASLFSIDWRDVQVRVVTSGVGQVINLAKASSYGFEGALTWRPTDNLAVQGNLTYLEARLDDAGAFGPLPSSSTALPGAAKWRTSETVSYRWSDLPFEPVLTLSHRFASKAPSSFFGPAMQNGYHVVSARLTLRRGAFETTLFLNNLTNATGATLLDGPRQYVEPPRSAGLSFDRVF